MSDDTPYSLMELCVMENTDLPNGYKLDIIPLQIMDTARQAWSDYLLTIKLLPPTNAWSLKVNMYQAIQHQCDRPAYVWHNYRFTHIPLIGYKFPEPISLQEIIDGYMGDAVLSLIKNGYFDLQAFCDKN